MLKMYDLLLDNSSFPEILFSSNLDYKLVSSKPLTNIIDNKDNYVIELNIPNSKKENINIELEDEYLIISQDIKNEDDKKYLVNEINYFYSFTKKIKLPKNSDSNNINAEYINGILTIIINKINNNKTIQIK